MPNFKSWFDKKQQEQIPFAASHQNEDNFFLDLAEKGVEIARKYKGTLNPSTPERNRNVATNLRSMGFFVPSDFVLVTINRNKYGINSSGQTKVYLFFHNGEMVASAFHYANADEPDMPVVYHQGMSFNALEAHLNKHVG